jgi:hypothetical protein
MASENNLYSAVIASGMRRGAAEEYSFDHEHGCWVKNSL